MQYLELICQSCGCKVTRYVKRHEQNIKRGVFTIFCSKSCASNGNKRAGKWQKDFFTDTFLKRFWARVDKKSVDDCWVWLGLTTTRGYGVCKKSGKNVTTHRISYELHNKLIPDGLCVLHKCDNRICVNPAHLFLGTHQDNLKDMFNKHRNICGERSHQAKLTEDEVRQIKKLCHEKTKRELGIMFNISPHTIYSIKAGRSWKHVQ